MIIVHHLFTFGIGQDLRIDYDIQASRSSIRIRKSPIRCRYEIDQSDQNRKLITYQIIRGIVSFVWQSPGVGDHWLLPISSVVGHSKIQFVRDQRSTEMLHMPQVEFHSKKWTHQHYCKRPWFHTVSREWEIPLKKLDFWTFGLFACCSDCGLQHNNSFQAFTFSLRTWSICKMNAIAVLFSAYRQDTK